LRVYDLPDGSEEFRCPVCGSGTPGPVVRVPSDRDDLGPVSTVQVHVGCLDLRIVPYGGALLIVQRVEGLGIYGQ